MKIKNKNEPIGWLWRYDKNSEWRFSGHNPRGDLPKDCECMAIKSLTFLNKSLVLKEHDKT